jgi:hypothetical protein
LNTGAARFTRKELIYICFLLVLVSVYSLHLFGFTLFNGFATFSNDSFGYILLARKWSLWFDPSIAETLTWPVNNYPPGFTWLLAITGASESSYGGHLVASIAMLLSLVLFGWWAYLKLGWVYAGAVMVSFTLLPGAVLASMGILSENPYLFASLAVLLLYTLIKTRSKFWPGLYFLLLLSLSLAILTRTVGIALAMALITVSVLDRNLRKDKRVLFLLIAFLSLILLLVWGLVDPREKESDYLSLFGARLGVEKYDLTGNMALLFGYVRTNILAMPQAFNGYLALFNTTAYFSIFSYIISAICVTSMVLRARQLRFDAIYLLFYFGIYALWPYPDEMYRFLHPAMLLLLIQPVLYFHAKSESSGKPHIRVIVFSIIFLLTINSTFIQSRLVALRNIARTEEPLIANSLEYYKLADRRRAMIRSMHSQGLMLVMAESAQIVPEGSAVAAVKHEALVLLADRESVNLSTIVPFEQQLCNFKIRDVEFVFISDLTVGYNPVGLGLLNDYQDISSHVFTVDSDEGEPFAHVLKLDKDRIQSKLDETEFECRTFQDRPLG